MNEEKAVKKFLSDIQCLDPLTEWSKKFNLFDMMKISTMEIRHSNVLAWLFDPNGNHGLGDCVLRQLIQKMTEPTGAKYGEIMDISQMDLGSFAVLREYEHIDILAISAKEQFLLCFENKIFSKEHDDQLNRYHSLLNNEYHDYKKIFIYLTPDGDLPEKEETQETWRTLNYQEIIEIIMGSLEKQTLAPDVRMVIDHYVDAVRRKIMADTELEKLCKAIYTKHKAALDLIFEYRSNGAKRAADEIKQWCKEKSEEKKIVFDEAAMSTKVGEISFTTSFMTTQLPGFEDTKSGWNDKSIYHYAIFNKEDGKKISVRLILSGKNLSEHQEECCRNVYKNISKSEKRPRERGWQWWTLKNLKSFSVDPERSEEEYHSNIFRGLNEALSTIERLEKELGNKI